MAYRTPIVTRPTPRKEPGKSELRKRPPVWRAREKSPPSPSYRPVPVPVPPDPLPEPGVAPLPAPPAPLVMEAVGAVGWIGAGVGIMGDGATTLVGRGG